MANRALAHIESFRSVLSIFRGRVFRQLAGPGNVVGVDIENSRLRIGRGAAPFGSAIESGKYDRLFSQGEGNELPVAAKAAEAVERPLMHFRRALTQKILSQQLSREGRGFRGQALLRRGHFSRHIAGRIVAALERKQRLAVGAVKQKYESLFRGLRYRVHFLAIALHG